MLHAQNVIHGLWTGSELPELPRMSIRSFLQHGHAYRLWTYDKYDDVPKGCVVRDARSIIPECVMKRWFDRDNPPNHLHQTFSNYFRYKLIFKHGGYWADMDFIALSPLPQARYVFTQILDIPLRPELTPLAAALNGRNIANGLFRSPQRSDLLKNICQEIEHDAELGIFPEKFGMWGAVLFSRHVVSLGLQTYIVPNMIPYGITRAEAQWKDPSLPLPNGPLVHFYNFLGVQEGDTGSLYDRLKKRFT